MHSFTALIIRPGSPLGRRRGFSLVELLVVISILALLLAILTPALWRAKALAVATTCRSRLHQWGLAFGMYAAQNDGLYPHIDGLDRQGDGPAVRPADVADHFGWVDLLPPLLGEKRWRDHEAWHHPDNDTIFQCPAAEIGPDEIYSYWPSRNGYFSYAMNSCLELDENCWHHPDDTTWPMPSFLQTARIKSPGRVILLIDQLLDPEKGYGGAELNRSAGKHCGSYPKAFSARHARGSTTLGGHILYCDSHVDWVETVWKSHWPDDLEVPPRDDPEWYPY